ncbi:MAG: MBL fold metallo-hydrolase [Spirochaetes bacterium]|nr:MBL fold metallo-hydrolase [Spirochaetota bacterium]
MDQPSLLPETPTPFSLANEGVLTLTFIGAGSAFSKKFFQNNLLIVKGQDHLLVDCGTRTPEALSKLGLSVTHVQNYLITHSHADHIGGLEEVMLVNRYGPKKKPTIVITKAYERLLWGMSLRGGASFNEEHDEKNLGFSDFWNVIRPVAVKGADRKRCIAKIGGIEVIFFRTKHIPDSSKSWRDSSLSYGLVIDRSILYTSDTRFDPEMVVGFDGEFGLKAIFHDCQLFTGGVHSSMDELSALPVAIKRKTMLMHYQDSAETQIDRASELGFAGFVRQWEPYSFP